MRVLLVEDERRDADLVRRAFARDAPEIELQHVTSAAAARERLQEGPLFDAVLADVRLPDGDGFELLREIRERDLPTAVVLVTGLGDEETAVAALKAGADDYVAKRSGFEDHLPELLTAAVARLHGGTARLAQPIRVLYAEHHATDIDLTRRHFAAHAPRLRLDVVQSSEQALHALQEARTAGKRYDVLLLDYSLPGESALELLRSHGGGESLDLPVILVTGRGDEEVASQALRLGATDYLTKHRGYLWELAPAIENAHHRARLLREQSALRESEDRYRDLVENSGDLICTHDLEGTLLSVNRAVERTTGYPADRLVGRNLREIMPPAALAKWSAYLETIREHGVAAGVLQVRSADGRPLFFEYLNTLRTEGVATPIVRGMARDVTDRRLAERALEAQRARLHGVVESAMDAIVTIDAEQRILLFNAAAERMFRCARDEVIGQPVERLVPERFRDAHRGHIEAFRASGETNRAMGRLGLLHGRRSDGEEFPIEASISQIRVGDQHQFTVILRDVTQRLSTERELEAAQERLHLAVDAGNVGLWSWNLETNQVRYSDVWKRQIGYAPDELSDDFEEWRSRVHPDDLAPVVARVERSLAERSQDHRNEFRFRHRDGTYRHILAVGKVFVDADGKPERMVGSHIDLTERTALESQLRHAQRLESIGRLAGGVAHDFNNLLTVIINYAEMAGHELRDDERLRRMVGEIQAAGSRAAQLTRQLLAFSRRQAVVPEVLSVGKVVESVSSMLRRLLGETVELDLRIASEAGNVRADAGQLEQVIVNLAVNARDAMPKGGRVTLEVADVELHAALLDGSVPAGRWVRLAVTDTGIGIDDETLEHLFEPFFTTKETGKGTGLGLATVHGIVRQSDGHIRVTSQLDQGTCFEIFLPRIEAEPAAPKPAAVAEIVRGAGTILVVEDEPAVRELTCRVLAKAGYDVLVAPSGDDALQRIAGTDRAIDLLITDVVMPGISGFELAERAHRQRPMLRILFISGYSEGAASERASAPTALHFLAKPFTMAVLTAKVREILAAP